MGCLPNMYRAGMRDVLSLNEMWLAWQEGKGTQRNAM
jgi:hypothetical protein